MKYSPPYDSDRMLDARENEPSSMLPPIHSIRTSSIKPQDDLGNPGRESGEGNFTTSFHQIEHSCVDGSDEETDVDEGLIKITSQRLAA